MSAKEREIIADCLILCHLEICTPFILCIKDALFKPSGSWSPQGEPVSVMNLHILTGPLICWMVFWSGSLGKGHFSPSEGHSDDCWAMGHCSAIVSHWGQMCYYFLEIETAVLGWWRIPRSSPFRSKWGTQLRITPFCKAALGGIPGGLLQPRWMDSLWLTRSEFPERAVLSAPFENVNSDLVSMFAIWLGKATVRQVK